MYTVKTQYEAGQERQEQLECSQKHKRKYRNIRRRLQTKEDMLSVKRAYRRELPSLKRIKMAEREYQYAINYKLQKAEMKARWQSNRVEALNRLDDR